MLYRRDLVRLVETGGRAFAGFWTPGGVISDALSNTGIYRKIKQDWDGCTAAFSCCGASSKGPAVREWRAFMGAEWSVQYEALGVKRSGHWSPETTSWCWQVLLNAQISRQKCAADILVLRTQITCTAGQMSTLSIFSWV